MLSDIQVERIKLNRGKPVRWRVERAVKDASAYMLKEIDLTDRRSLTKEVNRCVRDKNDLLVRNAGFAVPFRLVGIYDSNIDLDWINEDIQAHKDAEGE